MNLSAFSVHSAYCTNHNVMHSKSNLANITGTIIHHHYWARGSKTGVSGKYGKHKDLKYVNAILFS
jgi:hypothetical protein